MLRLIFIAVLLSGCSQAPPPSSIADDPKFKALEEKVAILEKKASVSVKDDPEFKAMEEKLNRLAHKVEAIREFLFEVKQSNSDLRTATSRGFPMSNELFPETP